MTRARTFIVGISAAVVLMAVGGVGASADERGAAPLPDGCVLGPDAHCPGVDLTGMDLSGMDLTRADLSGAKATGVNLSGSVLEWTDFVGANLADANLSGAHMRSADFTEAALTGADLRGADGVSADFSWANLTGVNATQASLSGAFFGNADVTGATFTGAVLSGADLTHADLLRATTDSTTLCPDSRPGPCRVRTDSEPTGDGGGGLPEGRVINGCLIAPKTKCPGADLHDQNLSAVRLNGSDLSKAKLGRADLTYADLSGANLSGADLTGADLSDAVLDGINLSGATLCETRIRGSIDNSGCNDRCVDAMPVRDWQPKKLPGRFTGSLTLLPYREVPSGLRPLDGAAMPVSQYTPLYTLIRDTFGGDGRGIFNLPRATGPWSGMRLLPTGPRTCLTWAIAVDSEYPPYADVPLLPNEVFFTAAPASTFQEDWHVDPLPELSSRIAPGLSAFVVRGNTDRSYDVGIGELKLFKGTSLPQGFLPADGRVLLINHNQMLYSVLGTSEQDGKSFRLPKVEAPTGYTWAIAAEGTYPDFR